MRPMHSSRRSFLGLTCGGVSAGWLAAHWPAIATAGRLAAESSAATGFSYLGPADAADVEAIAAQIVPSGATPGAREAHAVNFIDRALGSFFASWAPQFRQGLQSFQSQFHSARPNAASFAAANPQEQLAFLKSADSTAFFEQMRTLTSLGMLASPKYGGNYGSAGWKLIGFADEHVFSPPFGYYDKDYAGFQPYEPRRPQ
jgi:gluconate 2-dehydrogenase gamma chain